MPFRNATGSSVKRVAQTLQPLSAPGFLRPGASTPGRLRE